jgi:hypothetical protein
MIQDRHMLAEKFTHVIAKQLIETGIGKHDLSCLVHHHNAPS